MVKQIKENDPLSLDWLDSITKKQCKSIMKKARKLLGKKANENGFYVKVDSISSKFAGGYLRVIVWKPREKKIIRKY